MTALAIDADRLLRRFDELAASFGQLSAADRRLITGQRLRTATGRYRETLPQLVERTSSAWSPEQTAVANALPKTARLEAGQLLKVSIPEPYEATR